MASRRSPRKTASDVGAANVGFKALVAQKLPAAIVPVRKVLYESAKGYSMKHYGSTMGFPVKLAGIYPQLLATHPEINERNAVFPASPLVSLIKTWEFISWTRCKILAVRQLGAEGVGGLIDGGAEGDEEDYHILTTAAALRSETQRAIGEDRLNGPTLVYVPNLRFVRDLEGTFIQDGLTFDSVAFAPVCAPAGARAYSRKEWYDMSWKLARILHFAATNGYTHVFMGAPGCARFNGAPEDVAFMLRFLTLNYFRAVSVRVCDPDRDVTAVFNATFSGDAVRDESSGLLVPPYLGVGLRDD